MNQWLSNYRTALPWSDYQNQVFDDLQPGRNMLIEARAGSGKTTVLEGITAALLNQNSRYRLLLLAFNKHIAEELKSRKRIPRRCEVRTSHSMGYKLLRSELPVLGSPDSLKIPRLIQSAISKMATASGDAERLVLDGGYPAFLTKKAIAIYRSLTKSSFDPDVRFSRQRTVCCWSSSLHQNQLEVEKKVIYSA